MKSRKFLAVIFILFLSIVAKANVSLPALVSSNMVLQRNKPLTIWGWAESGEKITLKFKGKTYSAITSAEKRWAIKIPAQKQGGPFEMLVEGRNTIKLTNILIGDVYVCSGQSNMEFKLRGAKNGDEEIANANYPNIRFFPTPYVFASQPKTDAPAEWLECKTSNASLLSAVAYFFAREINQKTGVPIGLIQSHWGGTNIEAWLSFDVLSTDPQFGQKAIALRKIDMDSLIAANTQTFNSWREKVIKSDLGYDNAEFSWSKVAHPEWPQMEMPNYFEKGDSKLNGRDGIVWLQKTIELTAKDITGPCSISFGKVVDEDITFVNGVKVGETIDGKYQTRKYTVPKELLKTGTNLIAIKVTDYGNKGYKGGFYPGEMTFKTSVSDYSLAGKWYYNVGLDTIFPVLHRKNIDPGSMPTVLFNGMIAPLLNYSVKGIIWYQGEGNASRSYQYRTFLNRLITDWRLKFGDNQIDCFVVQLPFYNPEAKEPGNSDWAEMREAQFMATRLPKTYAVNIIDLGEANNIHPINKQDVGKRIALLARRNIYGEKDLLAQGPVFEKMVMKNKDCILSFSYAGKGLGTNDNSNKEVTGFQVETGAEGKFVYALGEIIGKNQILIKSPNGQAITVVRYAWANNPGRLNLVNSSGLPAYPFRTDSYKGITYDERYNLDHNEP